MPEYLEDPSVLTKDKLKSELLAHNVELPGGNPTKDVYVRLYLEKLTGKNHKLVPGALDAFSSDEELQLPPVVSSRSRSSGRKATRKTDRSPEEFDVSSLTDSGLKEELLKHGVDAGPIVASTRRLYEKKLQRFLDEGATKTIITEIQTNGNTETEIYSDKEDEVTPAPEPEPEPEPVPVVQRPLRSRGKTPVSSRTSSHTHTQTDPRPPRPRVDHVRPRSCYNPNLIREEKQQQSPHLVTFTPPSHVTQSRERRWSLTDLVSVEKIAASEPAPAPKDDQNDVLKELFPNDINSPTGISATCRRPIRGASRRPVKYDDFWNDENRVFSPKTSKTSSSFTSSSTSSSSFSTVNRVSSLPPSSSSSSSSRLLLSAPPPSSSSSSSSAAAAKTPYRRVSLWIKLLLLAVLAGFLFLVYQAMETNANSPFNAAEIDGKAA